MRKKCERAVEKLQKQQRTCRKPRKNTVNLSLGERGESSISPNQVSRTHQTRMCGVCMFGQRSFEYSSHEISRPACPQSTHTILQQQLLLWHCCQQSVWPSAMRTLTLIQPCLYCASTVCCRTTTAFDGGHMVGTDWRHRCCCLCFCCCDRTACCCCSQSNNADRVGGSRILQRPPHYSLD